MGRRKFLTRNNTKAKQPLKVEFVPNPEAEQLNPLESETSIAFLLETISVIGLRELDKKSKSKGHTDENKRN